MRRSIFALLVWGFALSIGTGAALAGGGSDSTGEGFHCYAFFTGVDGIPDKFAQCMVNEEDEDIAAAKILECIEKYEADGAVLQLLAGNVATPIVNCTAPGLECIAQCEAFLDDEFLPQCLDIALQFVAFPGLEGPLCDLLFDDALGKLDCEAFCFIPNDE